jgi:hypothetical protein
MVLSPAGLRPNNALMRPSSRYELQTHPLVREGTSHKKTCNYLTAIKNLVMDPRWVPDTKTDRPLVVNITSTSWVVLLLRLALSKGPNRVGVSFPSLEDGNIQFPKLCVL